MEENASTRLIDNAYRELDLILEYLRKKESGLEDLLIPATLIVSSEEEVEEEKNVIHYQIDETKVLGSGSYATVYLGQNQETKELYAIKRFLHIAEENELVRLRIEREAKIGCLLDHPNVVKSYQMNHFSGGFDIVMEYCDAGSIKELVEKNGPLKIAQATDYMLQALDGLIYLHETEYRLSGQQNENELYYGVAHRDIKPGNLLLKELDGNMIVKIGDYGLAKAYRLSGKSGFTKTKGIPIFTEAFVSKMQLISYKYIHPYVDVFSLTATYYYMLTGKYVRNIKNKKKYPNIYQFILQEDTVPIRRAKFGIPKKLAHVIDDVLKEENKAYHKDTTYTSARQLKEQIIDALK